MVLGPFVASRVNVPSEMSCCKSFPLLLVHYQNAVAFLVVVIAVGVLGGSIVASAVAHAWNEYIPAIVALFGISLSLSFLYAVLMATFWPAFAKRYVRIVAPLLRSAGIEGIPAITEGGDIQSRDWTLFDEPTVFLVHPGDDFARNDDFVLCLVSLLCRRVNAWPKRQLVCIVPYQDPIYAMLGGYVYKWIGCQFLTTTFRDDVYGAIERHLARDCNVMVVARGRCFRPVRGSTRVDDETFRDVLPMAVCASRHGARLVPCFVHDARSEDRGMRVCIGEPIEMERTVTPGMPVPIHPRPPGPGPQMAIEEYFDALKTMVTFAEARTSISSVGVVEMQPSASARSTVAKPS